MKEQAKESISLYFKEGSSDKVYEASIVPKGSGYLVNFAYGRRGNALKTGTKTYSPTTFEEAKKIYDSLVKSKTLKGYKATGKAAKKVEAAEKDGQDTGIRVQLLNEIELEDLDKYLEDDKYCAQEKLDGRRRTLFSKGTKSHGANRKGLITPLTMEVMSDIQCVPNGCILDGEDLGEHVVVFDILNNVSLSYRERYDSLVENTEGCEIITIAETAWTTEEKKALLQKLMDNNREGIVFKLISAPYTSGRPASGGTQLKHKFYATASCIVSSVSKSKRSVGIMLLKGKSEIPVGNVTVYPNQDIPKLDSIIEVKYLYAYEGGSLYQPVLLGTGDCTRDDIERAECTYSQLKFKGELE